MPKQTMTSNHTVVVPTALPSKSTAIPQTAVGNHWLLVSNKALPAWQLSRKGFPTLNGIHLFHLPTGGTLALSFTMLPACIRSRLTLPEQSLVAGLFRT